MRSRVEAEKMADVSLDEVIRQRGINVKVPIKRTMFGRGVGGVGKTFDARQRIGNIDARQRLGGGTGFPVKDAREKLAQKDARFKIRGRGGAGGVQDARQMINSRKQGQNVFTVPVQIAQKAAVTHPLHSPMLVPQMKIQANSSFAGVNARLFASNVQGLSGRDGMMSHLNSRMTDARDRLSLKRSIGATQTQADAMLPLKITKTIQQRPGVVLGRVRLPSQPLSNDQDCPPSKQLKMATSNHMLPQPVFSPLEGTKITVNNLHPRVTEEDIVELFCVCGALKRARLVKVGVAEVVFVRKEDAVSAYRKYNNRCLDGQPMKCNLHIQGNVITSDQPILLRLSDTPGAGSAPKKDGLPASLSRSASQRTSQPTAEVDPQTILKALFKSTAQSTSTTEPASSQSTAFRIKI
ncbi:polymerase delta-interacting protein 3 isoform X3 [Entelurus aequoreus]|uniref:polymerase delta-interacting protein 3 isoform X3 n=1 Tax=Entelurus aequoreus TaxID=161455 RepID=UPI002B1E12EA|nr:polymerase delta-interacting protein 3 isoform X3 [Entelurus aequoreus]